MVIYQINKKTLMYKKVPLKRKIASTQPAKLQKKQCGGVYF